MITTTIEMNKRDYYKKVTGFMPTLTQEELNSRYITDPLVLKAENNYLKSINCQYMCWDKEQDKFTFRCQ